VLPAFREALARAVEEAARKGWIRADTAKRWAKKLRTGVTTAEDKPKFRIWIGKSGGLGIAYGTTSTEKLAKYAERLKSLGLEEEVHFIKKPPKDGAEGTLYTAVEGVVKLAELAHHAEDTKRRLEAAGWVKHLLARAKESGGEAAEKKLKELIEEGAARGALTLTGLKREVEGHLVEISQVETWIEDGRPYIRVEAAVDGVEVERTYTFFRKKDNVVTGAASTRAEAPGGREANPTRLKALATAIFGEPGTTKEGSKKLKYTSRHLEHAMRFREVKEAGERWAG